MRLYNPSLSHFLSVDPISKKYPELTPYQFASNTPIQAVDLDGLEAYVVYLDHFSKSTQISVKYDKELVSIGEKTAYIVHRYYGKDNTISAVRSTTGSEIEGQSLFSENFARADGKPDGFELSAKANITYGVVGGTVEVAGVKLEGEVGVKGVLVGLEPNYNSNTKGLNPKTALSEENLEPTVGTSLFLGAKMTKELNKSTGKITNTKIEVSEGLFSHEYSSNGDESSKIGIGFSFGIGMGLELEGALNYNYSRQTMGLIPSLLQLQDKNKTKIDNTFVRPINRQEDKKPTKTTPDLNGGLN